MKTSKYDELKIKYEALLEENKSLKAKIREFDSNSKVIIPHDEAIQPMETLFQELEGSVSKQQSDTITLNDNFLNDKPVTRHSLNHEKISLFMSLFKGRKEVYAKKWQNKKGFSGYSPVCLNEWAPGICNKPKIKCAKCGNQSYGSLNESVIEKHLRGGAVIGIYPMNLDETCHFLAIDFDKEGWKKDISVIRNICSQFEIPIAIERSQSGNGCHAWFFFDQKVSAVSARKFGTSLLTHSMDKRYEISFKSYDRLFPNQDTMPKGGFGNLIALPLQKVARDNDNSVFIDENFKPYSDQWQFLSSIPKLNEKNMMSLITELTRGNDLGTLKNEVSETKPWVKQSIVLKKHDFPETVKIVTSDMLYVEKKGLSQKALNTLKRFAAFKNPEFYKAQAMRRSTYGKDRVISCSDNYENYLALPRGCEDDIKSLLKRKNVTLIHEDESNPGKMINIEFRGVLRDEQQSALDALSAHDNGVLSAATAFGKTVIGAKLISIKKVNTLVLVHRQQLLSQWRESLEQFLIINESLPELPQKRGRKKEQNLIGHMAAGKDKLSSIVDVAIMQSMNVKGVVREAVKNYGMIIIDECHHVPAVTFEQILKNAPAKYIYGLTATPARPDGHHPIIFFYCGPVRFSVDPKEQAEKRPFDHYLVPRFTSFKTMPDDDEKELSLQEIKANLITDEIRNQLILDDALECYEKGRKILILTGRVAHVEELGKKLKKKVPNVICLTGGMGVKKTAQVMEKIDVIADAEPFVLVATGSYIGEGFDEPRLDTLFLAMPIAWKGTLHQYAGRLHRLCNTKKDVQIYDYVDLHVRMLEKMYGKRLKGYASIGYKAKATTFPDAPTNIIFTKDSFFSVYLQDITVASKHLLIVSPFVTKKRILQMIGHFKEVLKRQVKITIITRPADEFKKDRRTTLENIFSMIDKAGISLVLKSNIHQKFAIIDKKITWYGSINLLSFGYSEESIMRLESSSIAHELIQSIEIGK
ncbi:MAG: DEAD/DEAH box helicase family protein [Desulfobacula sp.]|mgnify:FL=1|jgi:superfamily II DNA or RNA helicase|uniref:TOTE conflict system archaeo-eukaryotic primase domain-containing protein n=2 Tax=Desulfobacula sp. TaxID=2593537 RepID=UPI001D6817A1|nr:DEAD/DEAH box helicase family protein [Desulfobacula sp.]MBT3487224.1 DEAD/DEAH box helicase family protein [Desulfobacula sp.]MBT3807177.1 DEAD/DEAH box helicase family protein [Desulfobacula sp.]MBT4025746.1 DEAD/DEAH box helicase family protein [Desulfobacula sp.]MBT4201143.1 DEAD/DEAH box helicase family protein [Desulfobacula sp.]